MNKIVVANWKMNPQKGTEALKLFSGVQKIAEKLEHVETVICPPLVYVQSLGERVTSRRFVLGAQDAFWEHAGAFTGQVSPDMIFNARARYVIVGHSERRALGETDELVNKKVTSILQFPLIPIICVGEPERDAEHEYVKLLKHQLKAALAGLDKDQIARVVVAYEPIWALSTTNHGHPCTPAACREVVQVIKTVLADLVGDSSLAKRIPVLYGGSVTAENVAGFMQDGLVDGVLVGRASLDAKEFAAILKIMEKEST